MACRSPCWGWWPGWAFSSTCSPPGTCAGKKGIRASSPTPTSLSPACCSWCWPTICCLSIWAGKGWGCAATCWSASTTRIATTGPPPSRRSWWPGSVTSSSPSASSSSIGRWAPSTSTSCWCAPPWCLPRAPLPCRWPAWCCWVAPSANRPSCRCKPGWRTPWRARLRSRRWSTRPPWWRRGSTWSPAPTACFCWLRRSSIWWAWSAPLPWCWPGSPRWCRPTSSGSWPTPPWARLATCSSPSGSVPGRGPSSTWWPTPSSRRCCSFPPGPSSWHAITSRTSSRWGACARACRWSMPASWWGLGARRAAAGHRRFLQ